MPIGDADSAAGGAISVRNSIRSNQAVQGDVCKMYRVAVADGALSYPAPGSGEGAGSKIVPGAVNGGTNSANRTPTPRICKSSQ